MTIPLAFKHHLSFSDTFLNNHFLSDLFINFETFNNIFCDYQLPSPYLLKLKYPFWLIKKINLQVIESKTFSNGKKTMFSKFIYAIN